MGDLSSEPSMEDILSSIKRIIAEEGDGQSPRGRRIARPAPDPLPEEEIETVLELDQPVAAPPAPPPAAEPVAVEPPRPAPRAPEPAATPDPAILSARTAEATRGQLEALSRLIVRPETPGADTLEGLVREMLKPMLSQWLDANLPRVVETMVAREIERISSRREG